MAFSAADALAAIIATDAALLSGFHRLTVDNPRARLASAPGGFTDIAPERVVQPLPDTAQPPGAEVLVHGLMGRKLRRQQPPLAATAQDVEDGVDDPAQ